MLLLPLLLRQAHHLRAPRSGKAPILSQQLPMGPGPPAQRCLSACNCLHCPQLPSPHRLCFLRPAIDFAYWGRPEDKPANQLRPAYTWDMRTQARHSCGRQFASKAQLWGSTERAWPPGLSYWPAAASGQAAEPAKHSALRCTAPPLATRPQFAGSAGQATGPFMLPRMPPLVSLPSLQGASDLLGSVSSALTAASLLFRAERPLYADRLLAEAKIFYQFGKRVPGAHRLTGRSREDGRLPAAPQWLPFSAALMLALEPDRHQRSTRVTLPAPPGPQASTGRRTRPTRTPPSRTATTPLLTGRWVNSWMGTCGTAQLAYLKRETPLSLGLDAARSDVQVSTRCCATRRATGPADWFRPPHSVVHLTRLAWSFVVLSCRCRTT